MKPSYLTALAIGAVSGLFLSLGLTLLIGATGGLVSIDAVVDGARVVPVFSSPASALWIMVILASILGGFVASAATKAVTRVIDPGAESASLWIIVPLGIVIAPVIGMSVFPIGATVLGTVADGRATVSVVQMLVLAAVTGIVSGALIVWVAYILARPPETSEDTSLYAETADLSA